MQRWFTLRWDGIAHGSGAVSTPCRAPLPEEFILTHATALLLCGVIAVPLATLPLSGQAPARPLTVEAIFGHGSLIGHAPDEFAWSPDGERVSYLNDGELMEVNFATGKTDVLVSREKLASLAGTKASETDRDHRERYKMAGHLWAPDATHLLFDANGHLWLYDLNNGTGAEVGFAGEASGDDPKFSPDGESISFVRDHGLAVARLKKPGTPMTIVAPAPNANTLNGEVDWVYEEELETRSNYFWSPDSQHLAYLQMDESSVPEYPITDWIPTHATVVMQRYPQPGDPNPSVRVGVVSADGGKTVWVSLPIRAGQDYIPRFGWVDAKTLWI